MSGTATGPASGPKRTCDCGCGRTFTVPPDAPHKRFASTECRNRFHKRQRDAAAAASKKAVSGKLPEGL